jgi:hypothetical protein
MGRPTQVEDDRDLELQVDLEQSLQLYRQAKDADKEAAHANYLRKLRAFAARVLQRPPVVTGRS